MRFGRKLNARTKEELLRPPFVHRLAQYINNTIAPMKNKYGANDFKIALLPSYNSVCTNGDVIKVGLSSDAIKLLLRLPIVNVSNAALSILGLVFHELGHILYTPFSALNMAFSAFQKKKFWPDTPDTDKAKSVIEYLDADPGNIGKMFNIYKSLCNILEDGRIEAILLLKNGSNGLYAEGLRYFRKLHYKHVLPNISDELSKLDAMEEGPEKRAFKFSLYFNILLTVAKYGRYKKLRPIHETHPMIEDIDELLDYIENAIDAISADVFYKNLNIIFSESFEEYIKPYLDDMPSISEVEELLKEVSKALGSKIDKMSKSAAEKIEKATEKAKSELVASSFPEKEGEDSDGDKSEASSDGKTDERGDVGSDSSVGSDDKADGKSSSSSSATSDDEESSEASHDSSSKEDRKNESASSPVRISRLKTESIWEGETGCFDEHEDLSDTVYPLNLEAIGKTSITFESEEDAILDSLETSKDLDYGSMNENLKIKLVRIKNPGMNSLYNSYTNYIQAGKLAAKKISQFLKKENNVFYEKNHYSGSRFVASRVASPNLKYFDKKVSIPKSPTLSVAILVDQSGSMGGRNIEIARATAIALFEMCSALDISFAVFGHSADTGGYDVIIDNYCYFGEASDKDKYKLLKIHADGNNRDGAALRYVSEVLAKQETEKKLLFVISDGQPAAYGYHGTAAEKDIQSVIKDYERFGIRYIAAAIDADKEQIRQIYDPKRFLSIDDIESLPTKLMTIIRKSLVR